MEMILITPNKLKISISKAELEDFDLDADMLDYNNTETKRMLWDLLARAKRSTGFDPDGHRVFVQLYPSKSGDCELFVTKIGSAESSIYDVFEAEEDDGTAEHTEKLTASIFKMYSLSALTDACRRLSERSVEHKSSVYIFEDSFYLLVFTDDNGYADPLDEISPISEYGTLETSRELLFKIYEFGKLICEGDAIKTFSLL